jgi:hypothetical protein
MTWYLCLDCKDIQTHFDAPALAQHKRNYHKTCTSMCHVRCATAADDDDDDDDSPPTIPEDNDTMVNLVMNTNESLFLDVSMQSIDPDPSDLPSLMEQLRLSGIDPNFSSDAHSFQGIFPSPHQNDKQVKLNPNAYYLQQEYLYGKGAGARLIVAKSLFDGNEQRAGKVSPQVTVWKSVADRHLNQCTPSMQKDILYLLQNLPSKRQTHIGWNSNVIRTGVTLGIVISNLSCFQFTIGISICNDFRT